MLLGQFNHTSWIVDIFNIILTWSGKQLSSCVKSCCLVTQIAGLKTNLNWSGVSLQQRTKLYLYNLLITHSSRKRNANKRTIAERVFYTSAGRVYNSKPVDLRFESSWKSTRNFHFTRLTCNFLAKVDQHFFFSALLVEPLVPIFATSEVWILTWVYSELCLPTLPLKHCVATLNEVWILTNVLPKFLLLPGL